MIVDGKKVASLLKERIINKQKNSSKKEVSFIVFGQNLVGTKYVEMKKKLAESLGFSAHTVVCSDTSSFSSVKNIIDEEIKKGVSGIVVQLPVPETLPTQDVLNLVPVELDIDVLSDKSKELYKKGLLDRVPPVARAVFEILDFYKIDLNDKDILVVGNGKLVGEPVCSMFKLKNIQFDVIDKNTNPEISSTLISGADIIVSGVGSPNMIKPHMIKESVVLIDAGTSEQGGKIVGDVDPTCAEKALLLTPVPGGVGPVTLACLFMNI